MKKHEMICVSGVALVMGLVSGGCVAESEEDVGDEPSSIDEPSSSDELRPPGGAAPAPDGVEGLGKGGVANLGSTTTEVLLSGHGGSAGALTNRIIPPGVIYAVSVRSGQFVDAIAFAFYQPRRADNLYSNGDNFGNSAIFGGPGGGGGHWFYCPNGQGVIGLRGSSGALVDRIGMICGDVTNPNPTSPTNTFTPLFGGTGGGFFTDTCPSGFLVDSFNVRSSALIDNLQAVCIQASR